MNGEAKGLGRAEICSTQGDLLVIPHTWLWVLCLQEGLTLGYLSAGSVKNEWYYEMV